MRIKDYALVATKHLNEFVVEKEGSKKSLKISTCGMETYERMQVLRTLKKSYLIV